MNPQIQSKQLNPADLSKLKSSTSGMPKTESKETDKLADNLSGTSKVSFGSLANNKTSLESSLNIKAGTTGAKVASDTTTNPNTQTSNDTGIFSYSEQLDMKSKLGNVNSDIKTATDASIFSVKAGSSTTSNASASSASASSSDFSARSMAQTYISTAKDFAAQAETYAKNCDWNNVIKYYQKAQAAISEAQKEIQNAEKAGENVYDLSQQTASLSQAYGQSQISASNFIAKNQLTSGISTSTSSSTPGFWSSLGTAFQNGVTNGISNMFNGSNSTSSTGTTSSQTAKETPSSAGGSKASSSVSNDNSQNKLQCDKEYEKAIPQDVKNQFEQAVNDSGESAVAIVNAQKELTGIESEISKLDSDINKVNGETETYLENYKAAKANEAENQQSIDKETATKTEQRKLYDEANSNYQKKEEEEWRKGNEVTECKTGVETATKGLDSAKQALESAEANNKDGKNASAVTAAKQNVIAKEQELREAEQKLKNAEAELKQIQADKKTYGQQRTAANEKLTASENKLKELSVKQTELADKVKSTGEIISKAKGEVADLRTRIDNAYKNQTEQQKIISDNTAKHDAAATRKETAQSLADHAVEAYKDKNSKGFMETLKGFF